LAPGTQDLPHIRKGLFKANICSSTGTPVALPVTALYAALTPRPLGVAPRMCWVQTHNKWSVFDYDSVNWGVNVLSERRITQRIGGHNSATKAVGGGA
jgi:hypothetical protein